MVKHATLVTLLVFAGSLHAEVTREVQGGRIELGELLPAVSDDLKDVDIGRSPPPGSSRIVTRDDIARQVTAAGFDLQGLELPNTVRVHAPGKTFGQLELVSLIRPAVERALPKGVELSTLSVGCSLLLAPGASVGAVTVPKIPKRAGSVRVGLSVELTDGSEVTHHLATTAIVRITAGASQYDVVRGNSVRLIVKHQNARIEAEGTALANADIGETIQFRVTMSNKTLRARVLSEHEAIVTEGL